MRDKLCNILLMIIVGYIVLFCFRFAIIKFVFMVNMLLNVLFYISVLVVVGVFIALLFRTK